jgi:predicted  nucleic acid-binding Zn-ribbon protein
MDITTLVTSLFTFLAGVFGVHFWNLLRTKSDNLTKIDLKKIEVEQIQAHESLNKSQKLIEDLKAQNTDLVKEIERLEKKIQELKIIVEKTLSSFEMMMLVLKEHFIYTPELATALTLTYEQIKKATLNDPAYIDLNNKTKK